MPNPKPFIVRETKLCLRTLMPNPKQYLWETKLCLVSRDPFSVWTCPPTATQRCHALLIFIFVIWAFLMSHWEACSGTHDWALGSFRSLNDLK